MCSACFTCSHSCTSPPTCHCLSTSLSFSLPPTLYPFLFQDISSSHKSPRTATTALTPQLGPPTVSPSLLAYPLPPPLPHHDYSHRLYTMMRPGTLAMAPQMAQSIQTAKPCLTNDMGPPIFMPCELLTKHWGSAVYTIVEMLKNGNFQSLMIVIIYLFNKKYIYHCFEELRLVCTHKTCTFIILVLHVVLSFTCLV